MVQFLVQRYRYLIASGILLAMLISIVVCCLQLFKASEPTSADLVRVAWVPVSVLGKTLIFPMQSAQHWAGHSIICFVTFLIH